MIMPALKNSGTDPQSEQKLADDELKTSQPKKRMQSGDESYVCQLSPQAEKKAQKELQEIPHDRLDAVKALRDWLNDQPHFKIRNDTICLLAFLRKAKFSQLQARERIMAYSRNMDDFSQWFANIDTHDQKFLDLLDTGFFVPLPNLDKNGCRIMFGLWGNFDPNSKDLTVDEQIKYMVTAGMFCHEDEDVQVNGWILVFDMTHWSNKHLAKWSVDTFRRWFYIIQRVLPARFKAFHFYNGGLVFETFYKLVEPFLLQKTRERYFVHSTAESLCQALGPEVLPVEYLPDDYTGPHAGKFKDAIDKYRADITDPYIHDLLKMTTSPPYGADRNKLPKDEHTREYFRRLSVD